MCVAEESSKCCPSKDGQTKKHVQGVVIVSRGLKREIDSKEVPMWKVLNKEVDLGEPTSFLDHVHLGSTQRHCETSKDIVDNYRAMFESRISAG